MHRSGVRGSSRRRVEDLLAVGSAVFDRFTAGRESTLSTTYYRELASVFASRGLPSAELLIRTVHAIEANAG